MFVRTDAPLSCEVELLDGDVVIHVRGEIDMTTVQELRDALQPHICPDQVIVLDLAGVEFIDSACLHVLEDAQAKLTVDGGSLILRNPSAVARRLLTIAATQPLVDAISLHTEPTDPRPKRVASPMHL